MTRIVRSFAALMGKSLGAAAATRRDVPREITVAAIGVTAPEFY